MTDMLIRDVPDDVIAAVDAHAGRLGLSRSEYVRRRLSQDSALPGRPVTVQDLARFANEFADLADPDVMSSAWRLSLCPSHQPRAAFSGVKAVFCGAVSPAFSGVMPTASSLRTFIRRSYPRGTVATWSPDCVRGVGARIGRAVGCS